MAAGRGTRMRSTLPKVLHPVCGRPMLHWVIAPRARPAPAGSSARRGRATAWPRRSRTASRVDQRTARAPGRRCPPRARSSGGAGTVLALSGDHPLIVLGADRRARRGARPRRLGRHAAHHRGARPGRLRARRPRHRTGRSSGSSRRSRPRACRQPSSRSAEVNLGTYAFEVDALSTPWRRCRDGARRALPTAVFSASPRARATHRRSTPPARPRRPSASTTASA